MIDLDKKTTVYLINTRTSWNEPPRARHQVAEALSKKGIVVFIARNETGKAKLVLNKVSENLIIVTPYYPVDYRIKHRVPFINETYQNWLFSLLSEKFSNVIVINFDHTATQIYKYYDNVIYYCNDEFLKYYLTKSILVLIYHAITERIVARRAKLCIGVYDYIVKKLSKSNIRSYLIQLGTPNIQYNNYNYQLNKNEDIRIYYVGTFARINKSWLKLLLEFSDNWTLYMIGPANEKFQKNFKNFNNIKFLGTKTGKELYAELIKADICIAPYLQGKNLNSVVSFPNKFGLYVSLGKPIVTCNIPNLVIDRHIVYQSKDGSDFIKNIQKALNENNEKIIKMRIEYAQNNTWDKKIETLLQLYSQKVT